MSAMSTFGGIALRGPATKVLMDEIVCLTTDSGIGQNCATYARTGKTYEL